MGRESVLSTLRRRWAKSFQCFTGTPDSKPSPARGLRRGQWCLGCCGRSSRRITVRCREAKAAPIRWGLSNVYFQPRLLRGHREGGRRKDTSREAGRGPGAEGTLRKRRGPGESQGPGRGGPRPQTLAPAHAPAPGSLPAASGALRARPAPSVPHPPVTSAGAAILERRRRRRFFLSRVLLYRLRLVAAASRPWPQKV